MTPAEQATAFLTKVVQEHNEDLRYARAKADETPFNYGQDFEVEPEVWEQPDLWDYALGEAFEAFLRGV